ncbi:autophagy-related protein 2 [Vanrija albida]|uniref:Autophagy-related protein 2 n=1 Tax=Vanrija albida TaxID=181172 RepID=A0ABR3Q944_9TREE
MWFPSFLTFNLPSLPSISLPANIQRRFLSYVLRRALGRFVVSSSLDVERIQAQISQGWVEIERLEIDTAEINGLIPESLPFTVTSGEVAKVFARVPFPNLWSDPLSLAVESLTLEVTVAPPPSHGKSTLANLPHLGRSEGSEVKHAHHHIDLASSVTSAADDFVHDELDAFEGAELDRSIRESLILSHTDPFFREALPGGFPSAGSSPSGPSSRWQSEPEANPLPEQVESTTVLTGLVERILSRLQINVKQVRVRLRYEDDQHGGIVELRLGQVAYADQTPEASTEPRKTVRAVTVSSVAVYLLPLPKPQAEQRHPPRPFPVARTASNTSSSSSSMSSDDSNDQFHSMAMSQAVADLRESVIVPPADIRSSRQEAPTRSDLRFSTMTAASGRSIYQSVYSEAQAGTDDESVASTALPPDPWNVPLPESRIELPSPPPPPSDLRASTMTTASGRSIYHSVYTDAEGGDDVFRRTATLPPDPWDVPLPESHIELPVESPGSPGSPDFEPVDEVSSPIIAAPVPVRAATPPRPRTPPFRQVPEVESPPAPYHAPHMAQSYTSERTSRTATPTPAAVPEEPTETLLLSFGPEDIVLKLTTTYPPTPQPGSPPRTSVPPANPLPSVDVDLSIGTVSSVILPRHAAFLLALAQAAVPPSQPPPRQPEPSQPGKMDSQSGLPRLDARVHVKGVYLALVYDLGRVTDEFRELAQQFFQRPANVSLPMGHLRLRLEDIAALYAAPGFVPQASPRKRGDGRKKAPSGPPPPVVTLTVGDLSLFEYLASAETGDDEPPGGSFPVLTFDVNLSRQYEIPPGASSSLSSAHKRSSDLSAFPEFESIDWRNASVQKRSSEKVWKVKPKSKGILRGTSGSEAPAGPVLSVRKRLDPRDAATVELLPVHAFLDLSLVERLLPLLRSLAPLVQSPSDHVPTPTSLHPGPRPFMPLRSESIIDDLTATATGRRAVEEPRTILTVSCPTIRLDIRCPAPPARRGSWGDGAHLRSGIVTVDIHGLKAKVAQDSGPTLPGRRPSTGAFEPPPDQGGISLEWQKMVFLFSRVPDKRSSAFLVIGPLAPDPGDEELLLPSVSIKSELAPATGVKTQAVSCKIPSVQAKIRQPTVEGLQFFADDITHWLDGAFGDGSAPKPRDDLKMIGSRFFGSKASSSGSSSAVDDEDDELAATLLRVLVSEVEVALLIPKGKRPPNTEGSERIVSLHASDLDVKLESNKVNKQETSIILSAMDADVIHLEDLGADPSRLFGRTTPLTLTTHTQPLVHLRFSSITHADRTKATGIKLAATACTVFVTKDLEWVQDLARYAKTPEGVFEDVVPSEVTRIQLNLNDCSVHMAAPTLGGALLVVANDLELRTAIESDADENSLDLGLAGVHLLAIDDLGAAGPLQMGHQFSIDAWKRAGYAQLVEITSLDTQILRSMIPQETVLVDVLGATVRVTACADSLSSLGTLAGDMGKLVPAKSVVKTSPPRRHMSLDQTIDVFASVDLDAFGQAPEIVSGADMIEDDLPTNLDYLDNAARQSKTAPKVDRVTGESLRSWESTDDEVLVHGDVRGGTVRILMTEPFEEEPNYWDTLPVLSNHEDTRMGRTRVRVQNCNVSVLLHDGYDWQKTRKDIEDEIKTVRRRLEKIRQLLASGQKADASIEKTSSVLFNSVYIGLDGNRGDMDSTQLLAAIDDELDDLGAAETASQSSWQTFPEAGPCARSSPVPTKRSHVRLHGKRLTRSKRGQIEFSLSDLRADVDIYGPEDPTASRVHVTARSFDILDHIKTSTWKKFLTEMKSDSRGNLRETDANMVRLEIVTVRPTLPAPDEEIRVRAKILPLRLHVDQDALDFLKFFFSFQAPQPATVAVETEPKKEPFFQHVEIFPVELKLDYKPKRVDYGALRQGRTIELMNFFHFDGAEMTLRHVTLSGITGSTRLSNMLQDIWTPDVKANQLADVISGISPIRSVVNVGSGMADLILLPIEQYRKDGRVARGVQRGTNSFLKSTALELMKLGARLATGTQVVLERAEGVLGGKPGNSVILEATGQGNSSDDEEAEERSRYANQPLDVREGVQAAYKSLSSNINSAAQTILAVPMEVYERPSDDGPLTAVVRAVPIAVLKPMIGASEAVSKTLWGLRNTLDPEGRREIGDKYK